MNIQPNSSDGASPLRIDLTKRLREDIQLRQPLPPEPQPEGSSEDASEAVRQARDAHRDRFRGRVAAQRERHTANHLDERAAEVAKARAEHADGLEKRKEASSKHGSDSIDISPRAERLAAQAAERAQSRDDDRAARVRELRELYLEGRLDSDERVRRAADRILDG